MAHCAVVLTHADIVLQFDTPGGVELDLLQGLAHDIIWLALALLRCFDSCGLVQVTLVVDIEALEGIGEGEYFVLLKLGKLSIEPNSQSSQCGNTW